MTAVLAWASLPRQGLTALLWGVALAHLGWLLLGAPSPPGTRELWGDLFFLPALGLAALIALRAGARRDNPAALTWQRLGLGLAAWGLGQVAYLLSWALLGKDPFPGLPDLLFLLLIPLVASGLLALRRPERGPLTTWGILLDAAVLTLVVADVLWDLSVRPILSSYLMGLAPYAGGSVALALALAYPLGDLLLCSLAAVLALWRPLDLRGRELAVLIAGLGLFLLADVGYALQQELGNYESGTLLDAGWMLGAALMASAAALQDRRGRVQGWVPVRVRPWSALLPQGALLLPLALTLLLHFESGVADPVETVLLGSAAGLFLVRQFLLLLHNTRLQCALHYRAEHDPLTGARNREGLEEHLADVMAAARRAGGVAAVLFVALDRLKTINESFGHAVGDAALREVAARLRGVLPAGELPVRFGGDEFVLVFPQVAGAAQAAELAARVVDRVTQPLQVGPETLTVTVSVGVVLVPHDATDARQALARADAAMYRAKTEETNAWRLYDEALHQVHAPRQRLETLLRGALERGEFQLFLQPLVDLRGGGVVGFEALLRWDSPVLGRVPPSEFIPVAEAREMMGGIGRWVLREALRGAAEWRRGPLAGAYVSVNVSATQFAAADFAPDVQAALEEAELPADALMLELTESAVVADPDQARARLLELSRLGVRVALDDFGMGYSSLGQLRHLPVHVLKIDRSFVRELARDAAFVEAMVTLGQSLRLRVVAEGIEDEATAEHLRALGCDLGQGYLYAPPLPPAEALQRVRERGLV
ncbi:hypothetical protein RDMS_12160 [Deinococcus sp. RL]|uniref:putative bifunctional diguanylate cyclase/phosphodiesterase n=1 Tax=Deinococcus sp. RL TaxID=1489678 RepID=UPI0004D8370A|nr:bifunctional diguanylate cyclase/phosphodiesterase [Deinococcus sp. RL]KEF33568.1 hypothetical protein RDMS_12160 [Deinococcus sp. RL]